MQLDSVRSLKKETLGKIVAAAMIEARRGRSFAVRAASLAAASGPLAAVALGVAPGTGSNDYRLAVRLQERALQANKQLHEQLWTIAHGEVEVRYIGRVAKLSGLPLTARTRPVLIGASVGHYLVTAGTIAAFPTLREAGGRVLLSNNHVLANENQGKPGDAILQPGAYDQGKDPADAIGTLKTFVPLDPAAPNLVDAAIAVLAEGIDVDHATLPGIGTLRGPRTAPLGPGDGVFKIGRTTGLTRGTVTAIEVDNVVIDYEIGNLRFDRQTEIEGQEDASFSEGGDSGSLVVDEHGFAGGLVFAGTDQGGADGKGLTYANDLSLVLDRLNLTLDG
jgi:hypothetical protein